MTARLKDGSRPAFRVVHLANLELHLAREALHAATCAPDDGRTWRATHLSEVQERRGRFTVPVPPGGDLLDYVPFHFGARNLFLYNLITGRVPGVDAVQAEYITLVVSVEEVLASQRAVFTDGHALSTFTQYLDDAARLDELDWDAIHGARFSNAGGRGGSRLHLVGPGSIRLLGELDVARLAVRGVSVLGEELVVQPARHVDPRFPQGWMSPAASKASPAWVEQLSPKSEKLRALAQVETTATRPPGSGG